MVSFSSWSLALPRAILIDCGRFGHFAVLVVKRSMFTDSLIESRSILALTNLSRHEHGEQLFLFSRALSTSCNTNHKPYLH
jgi:hypothetical protein